MLSAPYDLGISAARAGALFPSALQRSDEPGASQVWQAVAAAIGAYGDLGCAARVAQAYGERPEIAVTRMRWALMAVAGAFGGSQPAHPPSLARTPRPAPPVPPDSDPAASIPKWRSADCSTRQPLPRRNVTTSGRIQRICWTVNT